MEDKNDNKSLIQKAKYFYLKGIWDIQNNYDNVFIKYAIILLQIFVTAINGIINKRILVQSASLSYATLLAIGPMLAITIIFSGIFFQDKGEEFISEKLFEAMTYIMPAFNEITPNIETSSIDAQSLEAAQKISPQISKFIGRVMEGSGKAGAIGVVTMLITCLLLFKNMESSFNYICDAKRGRTWVNRIVFYFSMIFFGSTGLIFAMTFFATSKLAPLLQGIPILANYASIATYVLGIATSTILLASFYKFIPLTRIKWKSAIIGAFIIVLVIMINNNLSIYYISYVVKQQTLYGYLAIVVLMMFSLYIFWTIILTGCQITYAIEYVDFLSDNSQWDKMGERTKKLCALAVFVEIEKAFYDSQPHSPTIDTLQSKLGLPKTAIKNSIATLIEKNYICPVEQNNIESDVFFKPAINPEDVKLADFIKSLSECKEDEIIVENISKRISCISTALQMYEDMAKSQNGSKNLKQLMGNM